MGLVKVVEHDEANPFTHDRAFRLKSVVVMLSRRALSCRLGSGHSLCDNPIPKHFPAECDDSAANPDQERNFIPLIEAVGRLNRGDEHAVVPDTRNKPENLYCDRVCLRDFDFVWRHAWTLGCVAQGVAGAAALAAILPLFAALAVAFLASSFF